ncbi:serum response factor isoform X2 [Lingula anatina]|uniref:Serum response factor isoform X2 n=1 Tax=Lingula anatina TaxID=7574 RepID=A0A1S3J2C6_LINAN|nr:serum response factor isoform X2 [Lingula anatina]|eukprot:XP_013404555.1 serum response factor isoform X2 [Lingula anatina]
MPNSSQSQSQSNLSSTTFQNIQDILNSGAMNATSANTFNLSVSNGGQLMNNRGLPSMKHKRDVDEAGLDEDSDSDSEGASSMQMSPQPQLTSLNGLKPGKKTKGRVKIKMEFIENKLRRYTTFSKRKTGIMKKAYELSTLTGTQVMLLVASETGHVYTFATRKLQPMITSESGKALIQTCLNSPDPPPGATQNSLDQRMNPTGFEETELTYSVSEEESKTPEPGQKYVMAGESIAQSQGGQQQMSSTPQTISMTTYLPPASSSAGSTSNTSKQSNFSMQLPTGNIATILPGVPPGTPFAIGPIQQQQTIGQQQQTVYRFPTPAGVMSFAGLPTTTTSQSDVNQNVSNTTLSVMSGNTTSSSNVTPGTVMYQTPQGVVYATPTTIQLSALAEGGYVLNQPQTPTAITLAQDQHNGTQNAAQQYITIPVPVSLTNSQLLQPVFTQSVSGDSPSTMTSHLATTEKRK